MIVDQDIYDHLEHHGVKGMHWGIRNEKKTPRTDAQKKSRNKKIKWGAYYAGVGALATVAILQRQGKLPLSKVKVSNARGATKASTKLLDTHKDETMAFIRQFNAKQNLINQGANSDLKKLYTMNDTPIRMREYLPIH